MKNNWKKKKSNIEKTHPAMQPIANKMYSSISLRIYMCINLLREKEENVFTQVKRARQRTLLHRSTFEEYNYIYKCGDTRQSVERKK